MSRYIDGFVIPLPKKKLRAYKKMAELGRKVWLKHGALDYYECIGDDYKIPHNVGTDFRKLCRLKPSETVIFAYIVYKSKAHRNQVNRKVMKDPLMNANPEYEGVLDMKRFSMGGFKAIVHK